MVSLQLQKWLAGHSQRFVPGPVGEQTFQAKLSLLGASDDQFFPLYLANLRYPFAVEDLSDLTRLVTALRLTPHPEGGFYRETYRTEQATAIYYLLTADTFSEMHRLDADEIYHFYAGDPVEILRLFPDGTSDVRRLGNYALMGTTMAPGFNLKGYEQGKAEDLISRFPDQSSLIKQLTRV